MNLKKLFVTAALALGLGVGAVAGISASKGAMEAKAGATARLYVDVNNVEGIDVGWKGANSRTFAYCHDGVASNPMSWPGQQMTEIDSTGRFYLDIDSDYQKVIFCRVAPDSNTVWNRSSKDQKTSISLPADLGEYNLFVLWHHNYDDGNYAGEWTNYNALVFKEAIEEADSDPANTTCKLKYDAVKDLYEALDAKAISVMKDKYADAYADFGVWAANQGVSVATYGATGFAVENNVGLFIGIGIVTIGLAVAACFFAKKHRA